MKNADSALRADLPAVDADTQRMLRDSVASFCRAETTMERVRGLRGRRPDFDRALWEKLGDQGWLGMLVPERFGGTGLGYGAMRIVAEQMGAALMPEPLTACAVLARGILLHGTNAVLKQTLLPALAAGKLIASAACCESMGEFDVDVLPATTVRGSASRVVLNGVKRFVTPASGVDGYIVSAREADDLLLFWVPASSAGLTLTSVPRADGTHAGTLKLVDVETLAPHRVASGQEAYRALAQAVDEAIVIASAELLGIAQTALAITLNYMNTRVQFGKPIGSFQALQHRVVDLYIQKELALGAVDDAVQGLDRDVDTKKRSLLASRAKSRCADAALLITREAIKLHGAIGFADECDIGLYFQRALVLAAWLGNGAIHRRRYSRLTIEDAELTPSKTHAPATTRGSNTAESLHQSDSARDWNAMSDETFRMEVRGYFERNYPEELRYLNRRARWSETREWALLMSQKGWIAPAWPREHGGMGLSPSKLIIYMEEQERWGVARAPDQGVVMLGPLLLRFGSSEQQEKYLPKIISCEHIWCQGYSEPNAGSDLASLRTEATARDGEFVINGGKIWTTLAQDATHMFMLARTDKAAKRQEGISFFVLDLKTPGVTVRPIRNIAGHEEFCEVFFDNVVLPEQNLVGEINKGWTIAKTLLGFERLNHGSPRRAQYPLRKLEMLARQLGQWEDAVFQAKYCKLRLDVEDLASGYGRYADIVRSGANPGPAISFLKIWATETFERLTSLLVELAGEAGSLRGEIDFGGDLIDVLGPYYCVFPATIAAGTNDIQRNILARLVLNLPR